MPRSKEIVIGGEPALVEAINEYTYLKDYRGLLDPVALARSILSFRGVAEETFSVNGLLLVGNKKPPYFEVLILMEGAVRISTRELMTPRDQHELFQAELVLWRSPANIEANFMHTGTVYTGYFPKTPTLRRIVRMYNPQAAYLGTLYRKS